jgi:siroheme synthase
MTALTGTGEFDLLTVKAWEDLNTAQVISGNNQQAGI